MSTTPPEHYEEEDTISQIDLLLVFARHKLKIIVVPFLAGCVVAAYSLMVPEIYTGSTTLIPSDRKQSSAMSMLSQLGPLAGMAGGLAGELADAQLPLAIVALLGTLAALARCSG